MKLIEDFRNWIEFIRIPKRRLLEDLLSTQKAHMEAHDATIDATVTAMTWRAKAQTLCEILALVEMTEVNNFPDRRQEILELCQKRSGILNPELSEEPNRDEEQA